MKVTLALLAAAVTLAFGSPAQAAIWDFSWLTTAMFGQTPDGSPPVDRRASGTTTATIAPDSSGTGLQIDFTTEFGPSTVFVTQEGTAVGGAPMIFCRDCEPGSVRGAAIGTYSFVGSFANPDEFTLALGGGGSGPAGVQRFLGTGTRQTMSASEPTVLLLVGGALIGAAWVRRRVSR